MIKRVLLGWDRPLLSVAVERMLAEADVARPRDLSGTLVLVPTAQSGRRLRQELALAAGEVGLLAPRVMTPEQLWTEALPAKAGTAVARLAAWREVLVAAGATEGLTGEAGKLDAARVMQLARQFETLRAELADGEPGGGGNGEAGKAGVNGVNRQGDGRGLDFAALAERFGEEDPRWLALAQLEADFRARLDQWQLLDPFVLAPRWPEELTPGRIVLLGLIDPAPRSLRLLAEAAARGIHLESWVASPEDTAGALDEWGRPREAAWTGRPLELDQVDFTACADGEGLAQAVRHHLGLWQVASDEVAVGICDPEFGDAVAAELSQAGWPCFDPQGRRAGIVSGLPLLRILGGFLGNRVEGFPELLAMPGVEGIAPSLAQRSADKLAAVEAMWASRLPLDFAGLRQMAASFEKVSNERLQWLAEPARWLGRVIEELQDWRREFATASSGAAAVIRLSEVLVGVDDGAEGRWWASLAEAAGELAVLEANGARFAAAEALELVLAALGATVVVAETEETVLELSGWLEMGLAIEENLILVGLHEGIVPAAPQDGPLMHDGLRERLGLRGRDWRLAVDALRLTQLTRCRAGGRVLLAVAAMTPDGEARLPSRLLLRCEAEQLPARVKALMEPGAARDGAVRTLPAWSRGEHRLELDEPLPRSIPWERGLSPSKINRYLACPLRFALENVWGMRRLEWLEHEMGHRDFGNLGHHVLEDFGKDPEASRYTCAEAIERFLRYRLNERARAKFGEDPPLPARLQVASLGERLAAFARWQADWTEAGWQIAEVERCFGGEDEPWEIGGLPVLGYADRIDFHPGEGRWMIWDYKTRSKARGKPPQQRQKVGALRYDIHWASARQDWDHYVAEPFELAKGQGTRAGLKAWRDVQLPLYARRWQELRGGEMPGIGQIVLATSQAECAGYEWHAWLGPQAEEIHDSARLWTEGAVARLRAGCFWPPGPHWTYRQDDFARLAPDDWEQALGPATLARLRGLEPIPNR